MAAEERAKTGLGYELASTRRTFDQRRASTRDDIIRYTHFRPPLMALSLNRRPTPDPSDISFQHRINTPNQKHMMYETKTANIPHYMDHVSIPCNQIMLRQFRSLKAGGSELLYL